MPWRCKKDKKGIIRALVYKKKQRKEKKREIKKKTKKKNLLPTFLKPGKD